MSNVDVLIMGLICCSDGASLTFLVVMQCSLIFFFCDVAVFRAPHGPLFKREFLCMVEIRRICVGGRHFALLSLSSCFPYKSL